MRYCLLLVPARARTRVFTMLVFTELLLAWGGRSVKYPLSYAGPFKNKWLLAAIAVSFTMHLTVASIPMLYHSFDVTVLGVSDWYYIVIASIGVFLIVQLGLWARTRLFNNRS